MIPKILYSIVLVVAAAPAVLAQSSTYSFDNFDTANGVKLKVEPPAAPKKTSKSKRPTGLSVTPVEAAPMVRLTSLSVDSVSSAGLGASLRGFTTGSEQIDGYVTESAKRNGLDPLLIYSVMHQESSFKSRAISPKGARGLMQLMPGTAIRFGVTNIFDAQQNIEGGSRYLKFLLDRFDGDLSLTLAGYNAGEGAVEKYGWRIPPYSETQEYVRRISHRYSILRDPNAALYAPSLTRGQLAKLNAKQPTPLTIYERSVLTVRLPDGRLQLMTQ